MAKQAVFTLKLEEQLRADFMAASADEHRPAAQVVRELMREFVHQKRTAQSYTEFLRRKVELSRQQIARGEYFTGEQVETEAAARIAALQQCPKKPTREGPLECSGKSMIAARSSNTLGLTTRRPQPG